MSTNFPGFPAPADGPEAPLEMLSACHDRMVRQCTALRRLVPHLAEHGVDEAARTAAANVMRYFDTSAFTRAGNLFGDTGRNILRGLGQANVDLALAKMTNINERVAAEWRAEFFNLLNQKNFSNPSSAIDSSSFGQITSTNSNARLIQFGLCLVY